MLINVYWLAISCGGIVVCKIIFEQSSDALAEIVMTWTIYQYVKFGSLGRRSTIAM